MSATTRPCPACATPVTHALSGREALETVPCPRCGHAVYFSAYVRMDVGLSEFCNLACRMCRRPSETRFIDKDFCKRVVTEAALIGCEVVSFCAGEPFVHPDVWEILDHAFASGLKVQMASNGTLIREAWIPTLEKLDCLTISLDGLDAVHDHIRGRPGAFRRTMRALGWLAHSKVQWGTNTVMQRDNAHQLYDLFRHVQDVGGSRYAYCGFSHVEVVPETAELQMTPAQEQQAHAQLVRIEQECRKTGTWFNDKELLLDHFAMYARKDRRYRPVGGCRIPQKFLGLSDHGFYPCWHQGRNLRAPSLIEALQSPLARQIVREGLEQRCVACNGFNYAWDEEWNRGMIASARRGDSVEEGVVPLGVPTREPLAGPTAGNTVAWDDEEHGAG